MLFLLYKDNIPKYYHKNSQKISTRVEEVWLVLYYLEAILRINFLSMDEYIITNGGLLNNCEG